MLSLTSLGRNKGAIGMDSGGIAYSPNEDYLLGEEEEEEEEL